MNLADAIRRASTEGLPSAVEGGPATPSESPSEQKNMETQSPEPTSPHVAGGNVVRLELFLTAEQMSGMFRAIMAGQHTVLTLREAASYLRINASKLVKLAEAGEVPGVLIEGAWRFPKPNLDDWLTLQTVNHEEQEDVA